MEILDSIRAGAHGDMSGKGGIVTYQITEQVIKETRLAADAATGQDKIVLMKKLRLFLANKGKFLVKMT